MRIIAHHEKFYDWLPVPEGTVVTDEDLKTHRARPAAAGGFLMKVPVSQETHTEMLVSEEMLIQKIISVYCDHSRCGTILTRHEALQRILREHVLPGHAHPRWLTKFEVHDDGPNEAHFRAALAPHLEADHGRAPGKNVEAEDVEELVRAYLEPLDADGHRKGLHAHFKLGKKEKTTP